jgi:hypothetical protein
VARRICHGTPTPTRGFLLITHLLRCRHALPLSKLSRITHPSCDVIQLHFVCVGMQGSRSVCVWAAPRTIHEPARERALVCSVCTYLEFGGMCQLGSREQFASSAIRRLRILYEPNDQQPPPLLASESLAMARLLLLLTLHAMCRKAAHSSALRHRVARHCAAKQFFARPNLQLNDPLTHHSSLTDAGLDRLRLTHTHSPIHIHPHHPHIHPRHPTQPNQPMARLSLEGHCGHHRRGCFGDAGRSVCIGVGPWAHRHCLFLRAKLVRRCRLDQRLRRLHSSARSTTVLLQRPRACSSGRKG